jgi:fucose 4-O-acetylase-like acetyltransferase
MGNGRNIGLDLLKGIGILLMILGHMHLPGRLTTFIFSFHMPLFFFVSGYLYRDKPIAEIIQSNAQKILLPYIVTGSFVWLIEAFAKDNYTWGLSILLGNGSYPVWQFTEYYVGPLWFLVCYSVSVAGFHYLLKIKESFRFPILLLLWLLAIVYKHFFNLLPFDILNAIPAITCLYVGYLSKQENFIKKVQDKRFMVIGILIWLVCIYKGNLSMASFVYRFWIFQLIGAFYGTFILYKVLINKNINKLIGVKFVSFTGRNSLVLLCAHSIDYLLHITSMISNYLFETSVCRVICLYVLKYAFVYIVYFLLSRFTVTRKIYNII